MERRGKPLSEILLAEHAATGRKRKPGGGRKPTNGEGVTRHTVTLRPSDLAYLRRIDPNVSAAIRTLIDERRGNTPGTR